MAGEHWRDLHRHPTGKFIPRPGKRGFKAPEPDAASDEQTTEPLPEAKKPTGKGLAILARACRGS